MWSGKKWASTERDLTFSFKDEKEQAACFDFLVSKGIGFQASDRNITVRLEPGLSKRTARALMAEEIRRRRSMVPIERAPSAVKS